MPSRMGPPIKHGYAARGSTAKEYRTWIKMKSRCKNRDAKSARYIDRGIKVCAEWEASFEQFLADMGPKPTPEHSLDRIDNNKGYNPENCRWATRAEQDRNKTTNVFIEFNGKKWCQKDFAALFGVTDATIIAKFHRGMTVDEIVDYYEKKHSKVYRKPTSSLKEALTSLGHWFNNGKASFFNVGEVLGDNNG